MNEQTENANRREAAVPNVGMCVQSGIRSGIGMPLGDAVQQVTHAAGLDQLANAYTKVTGKDCGCAKRREQLNKLFPI